MSVGKFKAGLKGHIDGQFQQSEREPMSSFVVLIFVQEDSVDTTCMVVDYTTLRQKRPDIFMILQDGIDGKTKLCVHDFPVCDGGVFEDARDEMVQFEMKPIQPGVYAGTAMIYWD